MDSLPQTLPATGRASGAETGRDESGGATAEDGAGEY
jgi:hypothetical protein